jgi:acetylornithine/N-succinyldiaminopimelate aminotransferase
MNSALLPNYGTPDLEFDHGQGSYLYSSNGQRYLDFAMGIAVNCLGHCHPKLVAALTEQANKVWHTSNLYRIAQSERLAHKLMEHSFADKVFFCNSGAEAVECGFKIIRRYHHSKQQPQRNRIVSMTGAFHGRTLATIAAAANPLHCEGFLVGDAGFDQAESGNIESLRRVVDARTAGIIIEPIQGENGIKVLPVDYLAAVRELCDQQDIVLMFDEVQCGVGRSGSLYAYQQLGVSPDVLASAKGLGGGFPVGACLSIEKLAATMTPGSHGSTFGGNPLAMAVANAVIDEICQPSFLSELASNSEYFRRELALLIESNPQRLKAVTGLGMMIGLNCHIDNTELCSRLQEHKLLVVKAGGNSIRLLPALNIARSELDEALSIISNVLKAW